MIDFGKVSIVIPAYKPDDKLIELVRELKNYNYCSIIVINDGSGKEYGEIFDSVREEGAVVLEHSVNMGKGRAIKTGYNYFLLENKAIGVVTADSDGQHLPKDIARIAERIFENEDAIILGSRHFTNAVPLRSRMGNAITRKVFSIVTAVKVGDTQTGLRGASREVVKKILRLSGERYEYEMNTLLESGKLGLSIVEVPIDTVYFNNNRGSHFNTFTDAFRIYKQIILFSGSAFFSFLVDISIFSLVIGLWQGETNETAIITASVIARAVSSLINFSLNKKIFIARTESKWGLFKYLVRYYALVAVILFVNVNLLNLLNLFAGLNVYLSKIIVEVFLYLVNFFVQRNVVFRQKRK